MIGDKIFARVLSVQEIPYANKSLLKALNVPDGFNSLGIITTDIDDVSYTALDEATKYAEVVVVFAKSMYAGSGNATTKLAGEFIGVLAGIGPEDIKSGMCAAINYIENDAFFCSANDDDSIVYFAHCISRTGSYLSKQAGVNEGQALAYLIAPPNEAICALDEALKVANVELKEFYEPPSNTNFAGGLLTGDQAACKAACIAFGETVCKVAKNPRKY